MLNNVLNGRYTTIVISIVLHILILIALVYSSADSKTPSEKPKTKPAIKSYIYKPVKKTKPIITPIVVAKVTPNVKPVPKKKSVDVKKKPKLDVKKAKAVVIKKEEEVKDKLTHLKPTPKIKEPIKELSKVKPTMVLEAVDEKAHKLLPGPPLPKASTHQNFSARDQLSRLRSSINNSIVNDAYKEHTQVRSNSIMHGEPFPVPHSSIQVTEEEERKKNTSYTGHNAITKNDNGGCTIHREQMLGSPVEASTSSFACGESAFDKNFREYMKKVRNKVMPER